MTEDIGQVHITLSHGEIDVFRQRRRRQRGRYDRAIELTDIMRAKLEHAVARDLHARIATIRSTAWTDRVDLGEIVVSEVDRWAEVLRVQGDLQVHTTRSILAWCSTADCTSRVRHAARRPPPEQLT